MRHAYSHSKIAVFTAIALAGLLSAAVSATTADEVCTSCGPQVSVTGSFIHHKVAPSVTIDGAPGNTAAFRED
ncbi:MAG TPA: hypothetical protein VN761_06680, partial [Candidatus Polarisedimenticolia bacterium]|nr:hypothetical protein [Candidatus Polarisedimenticolia bacterium]